KGHLKRSKDQKLFTALWKHRKAILLFMYQQEVSFDNSQAERDLRMLKVKMKISNHFQSEQWLNVHASIRSFISTAQKKNLNILECILNAHLNPRTANKVGV
ncbi:MAG: transposase, partial [Saprospiraceae bacterium]